MNYTSKEHPDEQVASLLLCLDKWVYICWNPPDLFQENHNTFGDQEYIQVSFQKIYPSEPV